MAEAEKKAKTETRQQLGLPLWMGIITSLRVCGSVCINDIVLCDAIMREFFNHSETSLVCDSSCPAELNRALLRRKAGGGREKKTTKKRSLRVLTDGETCGGNA